MATVRRKLDPTKAAGLSPEARERLDPLSCDEIEAAALSDPDSQPLTDSELTRGVFGRRVRLSRQRLGLSQKDFAAQFGINARRLQDWEQGRFAPDSAILAYLTVIENEPDMVRRILQRA